MQGWSASGQTFWWQGWQGTRWRRTSERRDQGRHWPGLVRAAEEDDRGRPGRGRQVGRARVGADEQVGPLEEGGRLGDRQPPGPVAEAVVRRQELAATAGRPAPPTTTTRQPSSRNRPTRRLQCRGGQRLAAVPAPRWTASRGGSGAEPAGVQPVGLVPAGRSAASAGACDRDGPSASRRWPRRGRDGGGPRPAGAGPARPGLARASGRRRPGRASVDVDVDPGRGSSGAMPRRLEQGQPRADLVPAGDPLGDVGQQEPAAAHRPADPPGDARQGQDEHREDVAADVDAQVVAPRRGATGRGPRPPQSSAQRPGLPLEPGPLGELDAVDVRVGLEDLVVARRGQDVDRRLGVGGPEPGEQRAGQHGVAQVVELDDQDPPRGRRPARAGRTAARPPSRAVPDRVERVDRDPPPQLAVAVACRPARAWA